MKLLEVSPSSQASSCSSINFYLPLIARIFELLSAGEKCNDGAGLSLVESWGIADRVHKNAKAKYINNVAINIKSLPNFPIVDNL